MTPSAIRNWTLDALDEITKFGRVDPAPSTTRAAILTKALDKTGRPAWLREFEGSFLDQLDALFFERIIAPGASVLEPDLPSVRLTRKGVVLLSKRRAAKAMKEAE